MRNYSACVLEINLNRTEVSTSFPQHTLNSLRKSTPIYVTLFSSNVLNHTAYRDRCLVIERYDVLNMLSGIQSSMFHDTKDFSELITDFVGVINTLLIDFVSPK